MLTQSAELDVRHDDWRCLKGDRVLFIAGTGLCERTANHDSVWVHADLPPQIFRAGNFRIGSPHQKSTFALQYR